jgi:hypothetical protein
MRYLLTLLMAVICCTSIEAQIYNTGILHITGGTMVSSLGDFTNSASADYRNDGEMYINGNIINDQPALPAGTGIMFLNGTTGQTLGGAADFRTFSLTMNNALGLTLSRRLGIGDGAGGVLSFVSGRIISGTGSQDVYFYSGSTYTGFDATHHIVGYVTRSGSTNFTFPIGDGTHTADLDLTALSAAADFQVLYTGSAYTDYTAAAPLLAKNIYKKEWWDVHLAAGAATAKVTLKWNDARNTLIHTDPANLVVAHFAGGAWQNEGGSSASASGSSTGSVGPSNTIASFSPFTFGSTTVALPIILSMFTATDKDCQALLSWNTQLEQNAAGFDIQQSTDGSHYTSTTYVPAKGSPSDYATTIAQDTRHAWYRIRMLDLDGSYVYSPVANVQLNCITDGEYLQAYPNPLTIGAALNVKFTAPANRGTALLQLFDMSGKQVYGANVQVMEGLNSYSINTAGLPAGTYTVVVTGSGWKSPHAYLLLRRN